MVDSSPVERSLRCAFCVGFSCWRLLVMVVEEERGHASLSPGLLFSIPSSQKAGSGPLMRYLGEKEKKGENKKGAP